MSGGPQAVSKFCDCGKIGFPSRRAALQQSRKTAHKGDRAYQCPTVAGLWHITSKPKSFKRKHDKMPDPDKSRAMFREVHRNNRRIAKLTVVSQPKIPQRPRQTRCKGCGRLWLSDLDPTGRPCPQCGGEIIVGRDREFHWRLELT